MIKWNKSEIDRDEEGRVRITLVSGSTAGEGPLKELTAYAAFAPSQAECLREQLDQFIRMRLRPDDEGAPLPRPPGSG